MQCLIKLRENEELSERHLIYTCPCQRTVIHHMVNKILPLDKLFHRLIHHMVNKQLEPTPRALELVEFFRLLWSARLAMLLVPYS